MEYCPECGSENIYESECSNINCSYCGSLFIFCPDCSWTDHEYCEEEEE